MIEVSKLTKKFGDVTAVNDVSFKVSKGEVVGFLGPNGAGKTTAMRVIAGFLPATKGQVKVADLNIKTNIIKTKQKIGYLPENNPLYTDMNPIEYLEYIAALRDIPKDKVKSAVKRVIDICGLSSMLGKNIGKLSKGFQQRVGLAQTLLADPEILLLDEPTTGLDPNQRVEIRELIKKIGQEKTVIISSHILSEVEATCNRVLIINQGKIVASGSPAELEAQDSGKVSIEVKIEGNDKGIVEKLKALAGVEKVAINTKVDRRNLDLEIFVDQKKDYRKDIIHKVLDHGSELLEIKQKGISLEHVFAQLTKQEHV